MKNQSHKISSYAILFFVIAIVLVTYPTGKIHAQPTKSVKIDKLYSNSQEIFPFAKAEKIYRLAISGSIQLYEDNSLIRVILVRDDFHEYLVYEAYPLIADNNSIEIINECEETCIIEGIAPHSLKIELIDALLQINELALTDYPPSLNMEPAEAQKQIKEEQDADKIKKLNENIKKKGLKWTAGETPISKLSYEEKKKLFGKDKVPNLQGAEYYKGGIFEIKSKVKSKSFTAEGISTLIESFDWRNRHGADNPGSPYYDDDPTGSGWITSVKNQGPYPTCWPFSGTGATEALVNLYFNQHLDLDLAEQDVISCRGDGGTINFFSTTGVVDEACFPYSGTEEPCENKCSNPNELIQLSGRVDFEDPKTEEKLKEMIIDYGPLSGGIYSWNHAMPLVGYDKDRDDGETIWIFKNSWGSWWGDNGYGYIKTDINDIGWTNAFLTPVESWITSYEIACNDFDNDGYYNWGIADVIPPSCPASALPDKDCDDNNPSLGPFDANGHCVPIQANYLYTPVTPCRIVDTRKTSAGIIDANTQRDFRVFGSGSAISAQGGDSEGCPSPGGAPYAAHINMIAVNPTGKGNLQAFPVGAGKGAGLSVNYNTIDTNLANAGTVKAITGTGPDITVASNFSSAHTVIDVLGYYYPDEGFYYTPVDPCRIVDTRKTTAGIINANTERDFRVFGTVADQGGDPAGCPSTLGVSPEAAHLNMVAVNPTGKGNLQAIPAGAGVGAGLSVNYNTIDTNLADAGTVKTSPEITVASNFSSAHTVIDVLGYYSEEEDLLYTPVTPCRIVDTRKTAAGMVDANTQRDFRVFGSVSSQGGNSSGCSAPLGEPRAAHINMIAVNPTGKGNLQAFPVGAGKGAGLSVNYNTIDTNLANAGTVKTVIGSGPDITVASNFSSAHTVIDVLGYYYPKLDLDYGLMAFYPFNGNANDESGNGNHGTVLGATLTDDRFGDANSAYSFDGVDDYVDVGNDPILNPTNDLTIAAWVKINSGESEGIVLGNANLHPDKGFSLAIKNSKIAGVFNRAPIDWTTFLGNSLIPSNTWSHLVLVYSGFTAKLYLNASNEYSGNVARWTDNWENFRIGKEIETHGADSVYDPFYGDIDDIRVYNRVLSEAEVKALFNLDN